MGWGRVGGGPREAGEVGRLVVGLCRRAPALHPCSPLASSAPVLWCTLCRQEAGHGQACTPGQQGRCAQAAPPPLAALTRAAQALVVAAGAGAGAHAGADHASAAAALQGKVPAV